MSDINDNTDTTDEPTKSELHERVEQLESTVEKLMPSRRDALKLGAAGIAGAAGLGAASQPAEAATGSAGQIGDVNNRPDVFADEVDANNVTGAVQGCRVFLSTDQSISAGTTTKIQFDSEVYDSDSNFDTSTHNWTCPQDGLYMVNLQVNFTGGGGDQRRIPIIGTATDGFPTNEGADNEQRSSDTGDRLSASTINKYTSGDTIAGYALNRDSTDTLGSGTNNARTFMEVAFLGGL
jgi:Tfp pilus assembly protein FimT